MESGTNLLEFPDHLPRLDRGAHRQDDGQVCAMEAAAWLAGERWSDHPKSVHQVIAQVARTVNDQVSDDIRQALWPLILASLDTARPWHPLLNMRLSRCAILEVARARGDEDLRGAWRTVIEEHARLFGECPSWASASSLRSLAGHLRGK
jgi:hypothetical protein